MGLTVKQKRFIEEQRNKLNAQQLTEKLNANQEEIQVFIDLSQTPKDSSKQRLFTLIALSIPILFFALLEIGLQIGNYKGNLDLFIFPDNLNGEYGFPNPDYAKRYFFNTTVVPNPSRDSFLAEKPDSSLRIFVLGESSAVGYPFGFNIKFSAIVKDALSDMLPNRLVEVVNLGTSAINSYTIFDQTEEVLEQKPDLILIYTGHNEFYGALGVGSSESLGAFPAFVRTYLKVQRFKTFLLLRDLITKIKAWVKGNPTQSGTLMERVVKEQEIPLNSDLYKLGSIQFISNMNAIVKKFRDKGIPVYFSSVASNLRDQSPFVSIKTDEFPPANEVFSKAQTAWNAENYELVDSLFTLARDLDALRFRATSDFNKIIKEIAEKTGSIYVEGEESFRRNSPHGIIGHELMLEHLHPNVDGYALLGRTFVEKLIEKPPYSIQFDIKKLKSWDFYKANLHASDFDTTLGNIKILKLKSGWPFVTKSESKSTIYFNPTDLIDSLAMKTADGKLMWEPAKVELAQKLTQRGQLDAAINEYLGIVKDTPYSISPYIFASQLLIQLNRYDESESLLRKAYPLEKNAYVCKMLGSIQVDKKNYVDGIRYLKESLQINNQDPQAWYNLSGAYALNQNIPEALSAAKRVQQIQPNYPGLAAWMNQLQNFQKK